MRTLNAFSLTITALALGVVCAQYPTAWNLLFSAALLVILVGLLGLLEGHLASYLLMAAAAVAAYAAGSAFASVALWLDGAPATILGLLATAVVFTVIWRLKSRVRRVFPADLLILSGRLTPSLHVVPGPAHVLPLFTRVLAVMPRNQQEHTLQIERVNVRSQEGPLGGVAQNINRLELELVYRVDDEACMGAFSVHNRDLFFKQAAETVGKKLPAAMGEKLFWVEVWRLALTDIAERLVRTAVHRSGLGAMAVSEQRELIEAAVIEPLREEALRIGLRIEECTILAVEPDESDAALAGREALLQALARAEEIKLTGDAQAVARQAQVGAMVEAVKAAGGQVPQRIVELIIHGVLPHTVLGAYVPGHGPGDTLVDLQTRPGGKPGDPTRN